MTKKSKGQRIWEKMRQKCLDDFTFLVEHVLWPFDFEGHEMTQWHRDRCEEIGGSILEDVPKTLDLWFRAGFKTTFISRYSTLYRLLRNPDLTILIRHGDATKAESIVSRIKKHFQGNRVLRELFPEFCPDPMKQWGTRAFFDLPNRKNNAPEHSVTGVGIEANVTGGHWMHIHDDDIENSINVNTADTRLKLIRAWEDTPDLLTKKPIYAGTHSMVGTPWHAEGLWDHVIKKFGPGSGAPPEEEVILRFYPSCAPRGMKSLVPEILTDKDLMNLHHKLGPYKFSCNHRLKPTDVDTQVFKPEYIKRLAYPPGWNHTNRRWTGDLEDEDLARSCEVKRCLTIDLAESQKRDADNIGYLIVDIDDVGQWFIHECFERRMDTHRFIKHIQELHRTWGFDQVYVDAAANQAYFSKWLARENQIANLHMPLHPVRVAQGQKSKYQRILSCQARWARGDCYVMEGGKGAGILIRNMTSYPATGHDDLLDAMAQLEQEESRGRRHVEKKEFPVGSVGYWHKLMDLDDIRSNRTKIGNWHRAGIRRNSGALVRKVYR